MIVDSSALLAVVLAEDDADQYALALRRSGECRIGAPTLLECTIVMLRRNGEGGVARLDDFVAEFRLEVLRFGPEDLAVARAALVSYGKGRHPARLNFGDCMAYATAKVRGEPLLYKGDDFARTDVEPAL